MKNKLPFWETGVNPITGYYISRRNYSSKTATEVSMPQRDRNGFRIHKNY